MLNVKTKTGRGTPGEKKGVMKSQKGQVLLITIMLLATALVVVLAVSFKSTTETQITKSEEEAQKALSASEGLLEATLQRGTGGTIADLGLEAEFPGFTGSTTIDSTEDDQFVTPLLQKDEQYSFYLGTYDDTASSPPYIVAPFYNQDITVYYGSEASDCTTANVALELTLVYDTTYKQTRYIADTENLLNSDTNDIGTTAPVGEFDPFKCKTNPIQVATLTDPKLLIIRVVNNSTKIGVKGTTNLRPQGKTITSQAQTTTGASKIVQLFQSYPQIPSEFFVTSF